jgi:hypothetical protein
MTTDINSPDYEHVNHPRHYNVHPSGVEAIDLCEVMEFNTGNAFKYLFRANNKGKALQDVEKALWYINREIERVKALSTETPLVLQELTCSNHLWTAKHIEQAENVIDHETDERLRTIYTNLFEQVSGPYRVSVLCNVRYELEAFIQELKNGQPT